MKWGLSVLDWRSHAVDERAEHPIGVLKAECGHLLMMATALHEKPDGAPCEASYPYGGVGRGFSRPLAIHHCLVRLVQRRRPALCEAGAGEGMAHRVGLPV